jgi:uncharacterized coiled-coil DUF342 family protein
MKASHYLADYADNLNDHIDRLSKDHVRQEEKIEAQARIIDQYRKKLDDLYGEIASLKDENKKLDALCAQAILI